MANLHRRNARGSAPIGAAMVGALAAILSFPVAAAQQRSFVASTGSDMALCTLASPCRSFVNAIAATNPGGEVIVLDSAGYGPVNIIKSISIIAPAGVYAGISVATGDGVLIDAPGEAIVLRGLAINGLGGTHGIRVHAADRVRIENCTISNMNQDGIHDEASGADVVVVDTIVRDNGNFGINLIADASLVLDHVRSEHNDTAGLHVGPVSSSATAAVAESLFSGNGVNGIVAFAGAGQDTHLHVDRSLVTKNGSAGLLATAASGNVTLGLADNGISGNGGDGISIDVSGFTTLTHAWVGVDRSTMTDNGGAGLSAHGGQGQVTVARSTFVHNADAQVAVSGMGVMTVMVAGNSFTTSLSDGIRADGPGAGVLASANTFSQNGGFQFVQKNSAGFVSMGDNVGPFWSSSGTITPGTGFSH